MTEGRNGRVTSSNDDSAAIHSHSAGYIAGKRCAWTREARIDFDAVAWAGRAMVDDGQFLDAVEAAYAAALDPAAWPEAFRRIAALFDAVGCTLELIEKNPTRLIGFWSGGVPEVQEVPYAQEYLRRNPRVPDGFSQNIGDVGFDYRHIDEDGMRKHAFYEEFLPVMGLRYYISCTLMQGPRFAALAVHRTPSKGHVQSSDIGLMQRLAPHLRQAFDVSYRLGTLGRDVQLTNDVLNWISDSILLLGTDGAVIFANTAAIETCDRNDGVRLVRDRLEFASPAVRTAFDRALRHTVAVAIAGGGDNAAQATHDIPVGRPDGLPPYIVSLRPVATSSAARRMAPDNAAAIVFIRDPIGRRPGAVAHAAREIYGLTEAEAHFAEALQSGVTPQAYARERGVSLNTVYTHLRRLKAKTGYHRLPGLSAHLAALRVSVRDG